MNILIAILLLVCCGSASAQQGPPVFSNQLPPTVTKQNPPDWFIDSVKIDFSLDWINPQHIASIYVQKEIKGHPNGVIYLEWKTPHPEFRSLGDISATQPLTKALILYIIDDSLIRDTANVRIEAANIFQVHTVSSAQIGYFPAGARPVSIVLVETFASFHKQEPQPGTIHLR
jgi:hypothetical protein